LKKKIGIPPWLSLRRAWPPWQEEKLTFLAGGMTAIAGISLFAMMVMMTAHVIGRKLGEPVPGAFEASEQLMIIVFAFPLAEVGLRKAHIVFELVFRAFSPRNRARLEVLTHIVGLALFGPLTFKAWQIAAKMFSMGEYRQGMVDFPIWPFRILFAAGLTVFSFQIAVSLVSAIGGQKAKNESPVPS